MGVEPLGDGRDVLADLVEFDDAQRLVGTMVLQQRLESSAEGQVLEGQRALAAVVAPELAVGVSAVAFWRGCLPQTLMARELIRRFLRNFRNRL